MSGDEDLCKFQFELGDRQGAESETLWASRTERGTYIVENIPFYIPGIAAEDEFSAEREETGFWSTTLLRDGGHATVWVEAITPRYRAALKVLDRLAGKLADLGCDSEIDQTAPRLALDVNPDQHPDAVVRILYDIEDAGTICFAVAKTTEWMNALLRPEDLDGTT